MWQENKECHEIALLRKFSVDILFHEFNCIVINKILITFIRVLSQRIVDVPRICQVRQIFNFMLRKHLERELTS